MRGKVALVILAISIAGPAAPYDQHWFESANSVYGKICEPVPVDAIKCRQLKKKMEWYLLHQKPVKKPKSDTKPGRG